MLSSYTLFFSFLFSYPTVRESAGNTVDDASDRRRGKGSIDDGYPHQRDDIRGRSMRRDTRGGSGAAMEIERDAHRFATGLLPHLQPRRVLGDSTLVPAADVYDLRRLRRWRSLDGWLSSFATRPPELFLSALRFFCPAKD
ncbi:hypothetical protein FB451DRAFT_1401989 [Mycena latifolia]|nr:hypothetical protein FB451DRAFT_1401989 [Mycena latifolia]